MTQPCNLHWNFEMFSFGDLLIVHNLMMMTCTVCTVLLLVKAILNIVAADQREDDG